MPLTSPVKKEASGFPEGHSKKWWRECLACPSCGSEILDHSPEAIRCTACGSNYATKFGKPAFCAVKGPVDSALDQVAPKHTWTNWRLLNYLWYTKELASLPEKSKLVDIGSGAGWFQDLHLRFETLAIDFNPFSYVDVLADINQRLPLIDDCADAVMLSNTLEHVYKPDDLLSEIYRILTPRGHLFLTVPFLVKVHQAPYDFYRYTPYALERMLKNAGFAELEIKPLGNIANILEIDRSVWSRYALDRIGGVRRILARGLIKSVRLIERSFEGLIPGGMRNAVVTGFDQGYACRARAN